MQNAIQKKTQRRSKFRGGGRACCFPPPPPPAKSITDLFALPANTLLKSDVTRRDHVSVVIDAGSRIVNFIVNFIHDGTVFA